MGSVGAADVKMPDVYVLILDAKDTENTAKKKPEVVGVESVLADWKEGDSSGDCRFVPGRAPNVAAVLYGKHPLQLGVVCDLDWRRKPVMAESIAAKYLKAGYHTAYLGEWGLGESAPYKPLNRGFELACTSSTGVDTAPYKGNDHGNSLTDRLWSTLSRKDFLSKRLPRLLEVKKPFFCILRQGRYLTESVMTEVMNEILSTHTERPAVVLILRSGATGHEPQLDQVPNRYFDNGSWKMYRRGDVSQYLQVVTELKSVINVWDAHRGLEVLIGLDPEPRPVFTVYHKSAWPLLEEFGKYRHRNSMITGEGIALLDGLEMYSLKNDGSPDLSQPMDLAKHQKTHQHLLSAYGQWWQFASKAIRNPRSFDVGAEDKKVLRLTALDWRPSQILNKNGKSPLSRPCISIAELDHVVRAISENETYRESFPSTSGSWSVNIKKSGRYKITAALLMGPQFDGPGIYTSPKLRGGVAHVQLGRNHVQMRLLKGATSVALMTDAEAGVLDLECWFTGQLALERELGAFFVEIQRVGEKKYKIKSKPNGVK